MQVSYDEGVANRIGPESCAVAREGHVATPKGARALLCTLAYVAAARSLATTWFLVRHGRSFQPSMEGAQNGRCCRSSWRASLRNA
jgi:hypothetical protein